MVFRPLQGGRGQRAPVEEWPREREGNGRGGMAEREGMEKRTHRKKSRTPTPPQPKPQSHNGNAVPGTEKNRPPLNRLNLKISRFLDQSSRGLPIYVSPALCKLLGGKSRFLRKIKARFFLFLLFPSFLPLALGILGISREFDHNSGNMAKNNLGFLS